MSNTLPAEPNNPTLVTKAEPPVSNLICLKPRVLKNLPEIDQASELISNQKIAVPNEIVSGLLHAGTKGVLAGSSKVGKTWLLLDLAASVAAGLPFIKWNTTQGRVLFINLEIHRAFIKKRLECIKEHKQLPTLENLSVWTLRGQVGDFDNLLDEIVAIVRNNHYSLIVLDPVYKLMVGRSEITASGVGVVCQNIERLVEKTGAAVVYAHHFTKGNAAKKKAMDRMSGSGVFARDADTIITLTEHEEGGCFSVEMTLRNLPPQDPFVVEWDFPLMAERKDLDPADLKQDDGEQAEDDLEPLLELLDGKPLTVGQWQQAALAEGYSRATFYRLKKKLEAARRVQFDPKQKTCFRAQAAESQAQVASAIPAVEPPDALETSETLETFATSETDTQSK